MEITAHIADGTAVGIKHRKTMSYASSHYGVAYALQIEYAFFRDAVGHAAIDGACGHIQRVKTAVLISHPHLSGGIGHAAKQVARKRPLRAAFGEIFEYQPCTLEVVDAAEESADP